MSSGEPKYRLVLYVSPLGRTPVQDFLNALETDDPDAAEVFFELIEPLVRSHGGALGMPHFKYLPPTDFSEIRWDGKNNGHHRIYCTFEKNGVILLLHAVTKRWPQFDRGDKKICKQRYSDYRSKDYDAHKRQQHRDRT